MDSLQGVSGDKGRDESKVTPSFFNVAVLVNLPT